MLYNIFRNVNREINSKNALLFALLISLIGINADKSDIKVMETSSTLDELLVFCGI
jgi:hypothetical protein